MSEVGDARAAAGAVEGERAAEGKQGVLREYFESAVVTVIMALFFMTFVAQAATVPSASMENTIFVGDHFLINKFVFAPGPHVPFLPQRDVRRGDVIVFKYPSDIDTNDEIVQYKTFFIKRVVGLPGETIQIKGADVYINGQVIPERRIAAHDPKLGNDQSELKQLEPIPAAADAPYSVYYRPRTLSTVETDEDRQARKADGLIYGVDKPYPLKDDEYFLMGDNRDNSKDSRFWGPVKRDLIVGRAMFVVWSYDESAPKDTTPLLGPLVNFIRNSRWARVGTLIR